MTSEGQPKMELYQRILPNKKQKVILIVALGIIALLLIAWFVWPSSYQYKTLNMGMFGRQAVRTNRVTGDTQICGAGVWQKITIDGTHVSFPEGTSLVVGGGPACAGAPWYVIVVLVLLAVALAGLAFLLIVQGKNPTVPIAKP